MTVYRGKKGRREAQREVDRRNKEKRRRKKKKEKKKKTVKKRDRYVAPTIKLTKRGEKVSAPKPKVATKELPAKKIEPKKAAVKKEPKVLPTIRLKPKKEEKTGIAAFREKETLAGKAVKILTSPKTTAFLATTLATMGLGAALGAVRAAGAAKGAIATITKTKHAHKIIHGSLVGRGSIQTQRAFIGRSAKIGVEKMFKMGGSAAKNAKVAGRYATNAKSISTTKKILIGAGLTAAAGSMAVNVIGTYPFAAFVGKEEAAQAIGLPMWQAIEMGDLEGAEKLLKASNELVNAEPTITDKIPYANVLKAVRENMKAVGAANEQWGRIIEILRGERAGEIESPDVKYKRIAKERKEEKAESEEYYAGLKEKREAERESEKAESEEYWEGITEANRERRARERIEDAAYYEGIATENRLRELEERLRDSEYFNLIREGKYAEAEALLQEEINRLKGGK